jgi:hypothetical protein
MAWTPQELLEKQRDDYTDFHTTIDGDHRYVHEGKKFSVFVEEDLVKSAKHYLSLHTPVVVSGKMIHWRPSIISSTASVVIVRIYEDAIITNGQVLTPNNMNRSSSLQSSCTLKNGVTVDITGATKIGMYYVGSGGSPQSVSGGYDAGSSEEFVLSADTEYAIEIEVSSVADTKVIVELRWYEE